MEAEIAEFKALKARLDKFEKNFKKCSQAKRTKGYLEGRLTGIEEIWGKICDVDAKINSVGEEERNDISYLEQDKFSAVEEQYFQIVGQIKEYLNAFNPQPQVNNNHQHQHRQPDKQSKVRLPKIELPLFSGSYLKWMSFKNRFTNLIHNCESLSPIEKLEYLKSCVTDEAERTIRRYQITDQNYKLAWDHLNSQYDNQRILQVTQVETIIDRKRINSESAEELRELIDVVQECLESLQILEVDVSTWDIMLIVLVSRKLPLRTRELWEEELEPTEVPTYKKFCEFLEKRYRTLENLELIAKSEKGSKTQFQSKSRNQNQTQPNDNRKSCLACNGMSHSLLVCETFLNMSIANRFALVNAKRMCKNCLAMSHTLPECKSHKTCLKCGRNHHTLLHRDESNSNYSNHPIPNYPVNRNQSQTYVTNMSNHQYQPFGQPDFSNQNRRSDNRENHPTQSNQPAQSNQQIQVPQSTQRGGGSQASKKTSLTTVTAANGPAASITSKQVSLKVTLFPTAIIKVKSLGGTIYHLRALLDQCSDEAYIKESVARMLGIKQKAIPAFDVTGLADAVTSTVNRNTNFELVISQSESMEVEANIVTSLVGVLPKADIAWNKNLFKNITLADPNYATPGNVDVMLGSEQYTSLILDGMLKKDGYLAQNTKIGWIISGKGEVQRQPKQQSTCFLSKAQPAQSNVDELLRKFWEIEEAPTRIQHLTEEERQCEEVFKNSYRRTSEGRVKVKLPFKENPSKTLGASRNLAVARWIAMEKKLDRNTNLKSDYMTAMQEHLDLGHMTRTATTETNHARITVDGQVRFSCYYIPHHAVIREESKTTKTRIVFDASAKTSSKKSLNDILMVGATIQESLLVRIMKWRCFKYVLRGDITKMYKQIRVYDEDVDYQRLVFRFNKEDPIEDFQLKTLTFGTASAPFMAIRTLKQLASDESKRFPIGSKVVDSDFHVDDLLTGGDSIDEVQTIWRETKNLLETAKFPMRKWSSNNNKILEPIPEDEREIKANEIQIDDSIKTLGISWLPLPDNFFFTVPEFNHQEQLTKRNFLSQVAKLFDPLGWLGPMIIQPKMMFQNLWKQNLQWDDKISSNLANEWITFRSNLHHIEQIRIPRWFGFTSIGCSIELHGFCDASIVAYGAVIYLKSTDALGNSQIQIVLAKSRVAPVQTVRLPRLELCGGVLLANLMSMVGEELKIEKRYCWTDSTITLSWIDSTPDLYKTFVANRIAEIQSLTNSKIWRHVEGTQNPADCLSRGLNPDELKTHELWWHGPSWLTYPKEQWPKNPNINNPEDVMECKSKKVLTTMVNKQNDFLMDLLKRYSSFQLLLRVTARIRIWSSKGRSKQRQLLRKEIEMERIFWIKMAQEAAFSEEIKALKGNLPLKGKSKVLAFYPFLDENGILRIGGRLKEALREATTLPTLPT